MSPGIADTPNRTRDRAHPRCVACGPENANGFHLDFRPQPDGSVAAEVDCRESLQGYDGVVQGGIVSLLLDSAMTNCLFAQGITAMTAELTVRFREPLLTGRPATVTARLTRRAGTGFVLEGAVLQGGRPKAEGRAVFILRRSDDGGRAEP